MKPNNINLHLAAEFSNLPCLDTNPTPDNYIAKIKSILKKFTQFGKFIGIEIKSNREIGQLCTNRTYLVSFGKQQLEFSLVYFHSAGSWSVNGICLV